jgi:hypothetical protein
LASADARTNKDRWAQKYQVRTCRAPTCRVPTCTRRQHIPSANISGANVYQAPTCIRREHVRYQLKGTDLTPFFSKNTQKLPFLAEEAQMNFIFIFFALLTIGSCPRLLGEHVQKNSQNLTARIVR